MDTITYSYARQNMSSVMERVCENNEAIVITTPKRKVVMMSLEDYESIQETHYLLSNPVNAELLRSSVQELDEGKGVNMVLADV